MYQFFRLFKRDFLNLFFNPMWIFFTSLYPFLLILLPGFLSKGSFGNSINSYDYYGITMFIYSILNTSMTSANSFMEESILKGNMRIIYAPLPSYYIYSSKILATFLFSSFWHLVLIVVLRFVLDVNFGGHYIGYIVLLLIFLNFFASILGILFCIIFKSESSANQFLSLFISVLALLGGLFFRLDGYGKTVEKMTYLSPLKWILTNIFKIIYDQDFSFYFPTLILLTLISLISLLLCRVLYKTEDYV